MALRKIESIGNATVYKDNETQEFIVKLKGHPNADYFADSKEDAISTAREMIK